MNNLVVPGFQKFMERILELRTKYTKTYQRVWFDTPLLRQPQWQSLQLLPESYASELESVRDFMAAHIMNDSNPFHGFKDYEVQRMDRDLAWMREGCNLDPDYVKLQKANFYRFFNEHDRRRGTDFLTTFPEMREWWNECKHYAQTT